MFKKTMRIAVVLGLALGLGARAFAQGTEAARRERAGQLLQVLKSDSASLHDKSEACRNLAVYGDKDAVPVLAGLLSDEKLAHMARLAMEPIPDPAVDVALRDALGKLKGRLLVGVIGSVGVRKDAAAVPALSGFLADADPVVAQAAARALGMIGTEAAGKAIQAALSGTAAENQVAFCEGLFRCAEALLAKGQREPAVAIYDHLRSINSKHHQVRAGAMRGSVLARQEGRVPLLMQAVRSDDYVLVAAAARTAIEMKDAEVTGALAGELPKLSGDRKVLMIQVLGKRADAAALPAIIEAARAGEKPVRIAAIQATPQIGSAAAMPALLGLMKDPDRAIASLAQQCLASLPGAEVDRAIVAMLDAGDTDAKLTGIELIGRRRMTQCVPGLLKAARSDEGRVRTAAIRQIRELAGPADLAAVTDLLMAAGDSDADSAADALAAVCAKVDNAEAQVGKLAGLMAQARPEQKVALLKVITTIGGGDALKVIRAAIGDANADPKVRTAAIRSLGSWKTADAGPDLLALAKSGPSPTDKILGLRGYLGLASRTNLPAGQRLEMCRQAAALIQRPEEKRLLLGALGVIDSTEAMDLIMPYVDDASTKEEACMAAATLAVRLLQGEQAAANAPKLIEPLGKVASATGNQDLARRARQLQQQARNRGNRNR